MSGIVPIPAVFDQLQATFADLTPPALDAGAGAGTLSPLDPFAVLLDAASAPSDTTAAPTSEIASEDPASAQASVSELAGLATTNGSAIATPTGEPTGAQVVADAEQYLGVAYQWGGTSPQTGFDCSGLVQHVYADLGIALPRTSQEQAQVGTPVDSLADAEPGDLLFFEPGPSGPGHVAIYFGDNEMLDAPETGETVQIQAVPSGGPIEIRRIIGSPDAVASSDDAATSSTSAPSAVEPTVPGGGTEMGNVLVPATDAGLVEQSAASNGMPAPVLAAVLSTESDFSPNALSSAGAEGIAQFMPATAAGLGIDPLDPSQAIPAAAQLLSQYYEQYGSWPLALAAYNAGPGAVAQGVPSDPAVQDYISTVLGRAGV